MRAHRKIAATALAGTLLATALALPASAETVEATFTVDAGEITIGTDDADKIVALTVGDSLVGGTTATGTLGLMTVSDGRAGTTGFTVSVKSSDFTVTGTTQTIPATDATIYHDAPAASDPLAVVTYSETHLVTNPLALLNTDQTLFVAASSTGAVEVSYTPTVTVAIDSSTLSGTYSGTLTQTAA